jgi:phosphatidylglycerol:prolipoprotein diacylglycerol transferase
MAMREDPAGHLRGLDIGIFAILTGLIGARVAYVAAYWSVFATEPLSAFRFWDGGLYWGGGVMGALLAIGSTAAVTKESFWRLLDRLAMPATFLAFVCWFACLVDHCAYGCLADQGLFTPNGMDVFGRQASRWPVQTMGAIFSLLSLLLLSKLRGRFSREGSLGSAALCLISAGNFLLTFLRGDPAPVWGQLRMDGIGAAVLLTLSLTSFLLRTLPVSKEGIAG